MKRLNALQDRIETSTDEMHEARKAIAEGLEWIRSTLNR